MSLFHAFYKLWHDIIRLYTIRVDTLGFWH